MEETVEEEFDGTLMFEQDYMKSRVIERTGGGYTIEFAVLGGHSISIDESNELVAKSVYAGLDAAYKQGLLELQEKIRDEIASIQDENKVPHIEGTESEDS